MAKQIGRNRNFNDTADVKDAVSVGNTSVVIAIANAERMGFHVNNNEEAKAVWIKLQPADDDDDKKGIFLNRKDKGIGHWDMSSDNIYTGEICAIADSGNSKVYVTEY